MVEYVRDHPEIHDVIISGGDPLTLPLEKLDFFIRGLDAVPHLDVIRIGTRVPVTLPQRLDDDELLSVLAGSDKIWIQTHFNHPREVTPEARRACDRLRLRGMPLNNHAVLLKGVNDTLATQRALCRALLRIKVRPYYLFHCDPVTGAGHFRTPVWKGVEIIEGLRGHTSGLGVPTYVVDAPRGGGKIPLSPNYLISASEDAVVLRNYEGVIVRYHPTGEPPARPSPVETQGVSGLLEGRGEVLVPEGTPRLVRRRGRATPPAGDAAPAPPRRSGRANGLNGTRANGNGNGNGRAGGNDNGTEGRER
jgi:lysine 2,3-aminomutase